MLINSTKYVDDCLRLGILTEVKIYKYPLRSANLAVILKAYANETHQPYEIKTSYYYVLSDYSLYLTPSGFEWLLYTFQKHSLEFLRATYGFVFSKAKESDITNVNYIYYNNFRGVTGDRPKAGSKQKAVLVRIIKRAKREFHFNSLREARDAFMNFSRFYPTEEFKLYRIKKDCREEVPLILPPNKRGAHLRKG